MNSPTDPCAFVPLSTYNWEIMPLLSGRRGSCNGITLAWNPTVICLFVALHAVAVWTALAVSVQAVVVFKRWTTVYFWSIMVTAWATIMQTITIDLMLFTTFGNMLVLDSVFFPIEDILSGLGFMLVLWSRLHVILDRPRLLKALLVYIVFICLPLRVVIVLSAIGPKRYKPRWGLEPWQILRRVEMVVPFTDMALAALYIFLFIKRFRGGGLGTRKRLRRVIVFLVVGELFVIAGDATVVAVWFAKFVLLRWAIGPFLYALKLQVEFLILNSLTSMSKESLELRNISVPTPDVEAAVASRTTHGKAIALEEQPLGSTNAQRTCEDAKIVTEIQTNLASIAESSTRDMELSLSTTSHPERRTSWDAMERKYLGR